MKGQLYRIKPLRWVTKNSHIVCYATVPSGMRRYEIFSEPGRGYWWLGPSAGDMERGTFRPTIEEAKAAAEEHYRSRLMEALEPLSGTEIQSIAMAIYEEFERDHEEEQEERDLPWEGVGEYRG